VAFRNVDEALIKDLHSVPMCTLLLLLVFIDPSICGCDRKRRYFITAGQRADFGIAAKIARAPESAIQILNEEFARPTLDYRVNAELGSTPGARIVTNIMAMMPLSKIRKKKVRDVFEVPEMFILSGTNYKLLTAVTAQLDEESRPKFIADLLKHIEAGGGAGRFCQRQHFPSLNSYVSYFPLIGEFCIRMGYAEQLFSAAAKVTVPTASITLLMMQVEDMISLNFDVFSEAQLQEIPKWLAPLRAMAELQTWSSKRQGGKITENPACKQGRQEEANRIVKSIDGIMAECQQARYFYLKGVLQQPTVNVEVENDKEEIEGYLRKLGFRDDMIKALDAAERDYREDATGFELKNVVGQLRSVLEFIFRDAAGAIAVKAGKAAPANWNNSVMYLLSTQFLTEPQEKLARGLYAVLSDEGAHPILAKAEFARLAQNMVIEFSLMFLTVLDKNGVKIT
jgi:hypothetical protein